MKLKFFDLFIGLFVAFLLISNIVSAKILKLGPFSFDGGTILFPLIYIFGDIFTEVYGYALARRAIWVGFIANFLAAGCFILVGWLPSAAGWENQAAYELILGWVPRIIIASLIAYLAGSFINSYIMSKMKIWSEGKYLVLRMIVSTLAGELVDTLIFCLIAFFGTIPNELLISIIISNFIFKCGFEIVASPITRIFVNYIKRKEQTDTYDRNIAYNPFLLK